MLLSLHIFLFVSVCVYDFSYYTCIYAALTGMYNMKYWYR